MKKTIKLLGIIALVVILALTFVFTACSDSDEDDDGDTNNGSQTGDNNSGNNGNNSGNNSSGEQPRSGYCHISGIAYGNGMFVAVGGPIPGEESIAYSTDGITWTASADHPFGRGVSNSVAYGNGKFVAVGTDVYNKGGIIASSTDGITWTEVMTTVYKYYDIVWGADKFVIGGGQGSGKGMAYSSDGVTWTAVKDTGAIDSAIDKIAWGDGKFIVGTTNIAYSTDGIKWTEAANNPFGLAGDWGNFSSGSIHDFAYGNGKYVAVGSYGRSTYPPDKNSQIAYSTDANNWTVVEDSVFGKNYVNAITWGNGMFIAGGTSGGKMAYSTDGVTWTEIADSTFDINGFYDIVWGNDKFVAVGTRSRMAYSYDGITWTAVMDSAFP